MHQVLFPRRGYDHLRPHPCAVKPGRPAGRWVYPWEGGASWLMKPWPAPSSMNPPWRSVTGGVSAGAWYSVGVKHLASDAWTRRGVGGLYLRQHSIRCRIPSRRGLQRAVWYGSWKMRYLGTVPDREMARRTGRSLNSIRGKRRLLGMPNPDPRSWCFPGRPWTKKEEAIVARLPVPEAAAHIQRSVGAVYQRRKKLGLNE